MDCLLCTIITMPKKDVLPKQSVEGSQTVELQNKI